MGVKFSVEDTRFRSGKGSRSVTDKAATAGDVEFKMLVKDGVSLKFAEIGGKTWWDLRVLHSELKVKEDYVVWGKRRLEGYTEDTDWRIVWFSGKRVVLVTSEVAKRIADSECTVSAEKAASVVDRPNGVQEATVPQIFTFETNTVRVIIRGDEPWWVLSDVCAILGLSNTPKVAERLKSGQKDTITLSDSVNRPHQNTIINESGLYRVIFRSDKPEAERFQEWVFGEVLPQIRKTGSYGAVVPVLTREQKVAEAFLISQEMLAEAKQQIEALSTKVGHLQAFNKYTVTALRDKLIPAYHANRLMAQSGQIGDAKNFRTFINHYRLNKDIGATRLFEVARNWNLVCKTSCRPTQYALQNGWLVEADGSYQVGDRKIRRYTSAITPDGQVYFLERLSKEAVLTLSPETLALKTELETRLNAELASVT